jgi:alpha-tubulin suppressor-like RCC1 family protein
VVDQTVVCWDVRITENPVQTNLTFKARVESTAVGDGFVCAVVRPAQSAGTVWCWGKDLYGGFASNSSIGVNVKSLPGTLLDVAAGNAHVCALVRTASSNSGQVYCWGNNLYGVLGQGYTNGTEVNPQGSSMSLRVKGLADVTALYGGYAGNCAVVAGRRTFCWGSNYNGQLSTKPIGRNIVTMPTAMDGLCV